MDTTINYLHLDHLGSTSVISDSTGTQTETIRYFPFGECRNSPPEIEDFPTDKLFTGQRLDDTGLYYYNARYYDPLIGRFISPDPFVQINSGLPNCSSFLCINLTLVQNAPKTTDFVTINPQSLNRYTYVLNNPLKHTDPSGYWNWRKFWTGIAIVAAVALITVAVCYAAPIIVPTIGATIAAEGGGLALWTAAEVAIYGGGGICTLVGIGTVGASIAASGAMEPSPPELPLENKSDDASKVQTIENKDSSSVSETSTTNPAQVTQSVSSTSTQNKNIYGKTRSSGVQFE